MRSVISLRTRENSYKAYNRASELVKIFQRKSLETKTASLSWCIYSCDIKVVLGIWWATAS